MFETDARSSPYGWAIKISYVDVDRPALKLYEFPIIFDKWNSVNEAFQTRLANLQYMTEQDSNDLVIFDNYSAAIKWITQDTQLEAAQEQFEKSFFEKQQKAKRDAEENEDYWDGTTRIQAEYMPYKVKNALECIKVPTCNLHNKKIEQPVNNYMTLTRWNSMDDHTKKIIQDNFNSKDEGSVADLASEEDDLIAQIKHHEVSKLCRQ